MQSLSSDELADAVLSASRALVGVAARSLSAVAEDVTLPQYRALVVLSAHGPLGMSELSGLLACSPSTTTRLCDRLVRKRLLRRDHRATNRREVEVAVTPDARHLVAQVTERRRREITVILKRVPRAERVSMVRALHRFASAAGEVPDQAWATGWAL